MGRLSALSGFLVSVMLMVGCTNKGGDVAGGTEVGNAGLTGEVRYQDGSAAGNASVKVFSSTASFNNPTPTATLTTNSDGTYAIEKLAAGTYSVVIQDSLGNAAKTDSVVIQSREVTLVDTLKTTGRIRGTLLVVGAATQYGTIAYIPGTTYFAGSDETGTFVFEAVPEGKSTVVMLRSPFDPVVRTIVVISGREVLIDTVRLNSGSQLVAPTALLSYDSTIQNIRLSWNAPASRITGYNLYRRVNQGKFLFYERLGSTETEFAESWLNGIEQDSVYSYALGALDGSGMEGATCTLSCKAVGRTVVLDSIVLPDYPISMSGSGNSVGILLENGSVIQINDDNPKVIQPVVASCNSDNPKFIAWNGTAEKSFFLDTVGAGFVNSSTCEKVALPGFKSDDVLSMVSVFDSSIALRLNDGLVLYDMNTDDWKNIPVQGISRLSFADSTICCMSSEKAFLLNSVGKPIDTLFPSRLRLTSFQPVLNVTGYGDKHWAFIVDSKVRMVSWNKKETKENFLLSPQFSLQKQFAISGKFIWFCRRLSQTIYFIKQ